MLAVADVSRWLQSQWSVMAPEDWTEACLAWIHEEHAGQQLSPQQTRNAVYEQWLLSDLRELESSCLPLAIRQQEKYMLKGRYSLQMDSLVDVSTPYYSQLQKVTGKENANALVSAATQATQNRWEAKSSRMFMLRLTDGCQDIQAMEYERIPALNPTLTSGCKVQIQGEILCRLGVLMLKANNLKVLGGEVETQVEENGTLRTLEKALNHNVGLSENPPENHRQEFQTSTAPSNNHRTSNRYPQNGSNPPARQGLGRQQQAPQPAGRQHQQNLAMETNFDDPMGIDDAELATLDGPAMTAMESEWDDDIDYEAMMEQMDSSPTVSPHPTSDTNVVKTTSGLQKSEVIQMAPAPDPDDWEPDVDELEAMAELEGNSWAPSGPPSMSHGRNRPSTQWQSAAAHKEPTVSRSVPKYGSNASSSQLSSSISYPSTNAATSSEFKASPSVYTSIKSDNKSNFTNIKQEIKQEPRSSTGLGNMSTRVKQETSGLSIKVKTELSVTMDSKAKTNLGKQQKLDSFFNRSATMKVESKPEVIDLDSSPESKKARMTSGPSSCDVLPVARKKELELISRPWTSLKYVAAAYPVQALSTVRVKAYISTLIGRLSHNEGTHWSLVVKMNDGSAAVDADMADEMLTELIGFSAAESLVLKKQARTDKQIKQRLSQGISHCQRTLISLSCILELQLIPNAQRPCVLRKLDVSPQDLLQLRNRVSV